MSALDCTWDVPLKHRRGGETRLGGIDVFHEFDWLDVFPDRRTQFKNGQCLAKFVQKACPSDKTPALLLTLRDAPKQGLLRTPKFLVFVVNLPEYTASAGDAASSYLASHLEVDITDIDELQALVASAGPDLLRAFVASHIDLDHVTTWAAGSEERLNALRGVVGSSDGRRAPSSLAEAINALGGLTKLDADEVASIAGLFGAEADQEQRLELLRAITADPSGRYVTGEVLAERTPQRIEDARQAMGDYQALLDDETSNETSMQKFIEKNLWLLGLDYAKMRARQRGPSGAMDFFLERYDGFHDLLELKSPHDDLIRAPNVAEDDPAPPPHEYALSSTLAQALAQAIVYRDRLTRYPDVSRELYGLSQSREPRLIVVIGKADSLPEHRKRVLLELNRSLHRIEIVPYDVLAKRAEAVLNNVELYLLAAQEVASNGEGLPPEAEQEH